MGPFQKLGRWLLCLIAIGSSYVPYLTLTGLPDVYTAILVTTILPLAGAAFLVNATFETWLYPAFGLGKSKLT